jgi:hypothetical protein
MDKIHHIRLMRNNKDGLEWRLVCSEKLVNKEKVVGRIEMATCPSCREKTEARLKRISKKYNPLIDKIPWVEEAIKDGVIF